MKRPNFLSNKKVTCDFCGEIFLGNLNPENLIMCYKCLSNLCSWPDKEKIEFLRRFKGHKNKEKLIRRFINEEVIEDGEAKDNTEHNSRVGSDGESSWYKKDKIWKVQDSFVLGKTRS